MLFAWIFPSFLLLVDCFIVPKLLPDFITPCSDYPNLLKCPAQLLERLRHRLVQGIPEFQLPPIDPLFVPHVTLTRRGTTIADYTANITDVFWTGLGNFKILETFVDLDTLIFRIMLSFPYLAAHGNMFANGKLLSFEMRGGGDFLNNATNVVFDIVLNGERYELNGLEYLTWNTEDVQLNFDEFEFLHLSGLFEDPTVLHLFKMALNRGTRLIGTTLKQFVDKSVGRFIIESINRVHSVYSRDVLYPSF